MRCVILLFLLFVCFSSNAQIEQDKALHYLGGNLYGLAGAGIAKQISKGNRFWTFAGAIGGSTLIGLGKEAIDTSKGGSGWDNDDLLATILGGATVGLTIDIFTNKKRDKRRRREGSLTVDTFQPEPVNFNESVTAELPNLTTLTNPGLLK